MGGEGYEVSEREGKREKTNWEDRYGKQETGEGMVETQCASTQVCKSVNVQCGECRTVAV